MSLFFLAAIVAVCVRWGMPPSVVLASAAAPYHCADLNQDYRINGTEFNRVQAYWRAGSYYAEPLGADGYAPGKGSQEGVPHCSDYNGDWKISGSEYLRVLLYWRDAHGYIAHPEGFDGFALCSSCPFGCAAGACLPDPASALRCGDGIRSSPIGPHAVRTTVAAITAYLDSIRTSALDVDGNGQADALTDGVLINRYLEGTRGESLTVGALAPDASRTTPEDILAFLDTYSAAYDVDGNGVMAVAEDGKLIFRYLFGQTGAALIGEQCDDGNTNDGDGCSALCMMEPENKARTLLGCQSGSCDLRHVVAIMREVRSALFTFSPVWDVTGEGMVNQFDLAVYLGVIGSSDIQWTYKAFTVLDRGDFDLTQEDIDAVLPLVVQKLFTAYPSYDVTEQHDTINQFDLAVYLGVIADFGLQHAALPVPTTVQITAVPAAPVEGQRVTWTVNIVPATEQVPAVEINGTVQLTIDDRTVDVAVAQGQATYADPQALSAGTHTISAAYTGNDVYASSVSSVSLVISAQQQPQSPVTRGTGGSGGRRGAGLLSALPFQAQSTIAPAAFGGTLSLPVLTRTQKITICRIQNRKPPFTNAVLGRLAVRLTQRWKWTLAQAQSALENRLICK